jgi:hypothetical protein
MLKESMIVHMSPSRGVKNSLMKSSRTMDSFNMFLDFNRKISSNY